MDSTVIHASVTRPTTQPSYMIQTSISVGESPAADPHATKKSMKDTQDP